MATGPKKITFKIANFRLGFYALSDCVEFKLMKNKIMIFNFFMKDAQIRRLRNWLNWFLDNK